MNTVRVVVIPPDGPAEVRQVGRTLADWQSLVGGYVEGLTLTGSIRAYINEDGKALGLPINHTGNSLVTLYLTRSHRRLLPGDVVVGPVVLVGTEDADGENTDLPDAVLDELRHFGVLRDA